MQINRLIQKAITNNKFPLACLHDPNKVQKPQKNLPRFAKYDLSENSKHDCRVLVAIITMRAAFQNCSKLLKLLC